MFTIAFVFYCVLRNTSSQSELAFDLRLSGRVADSRLTLSSDCFPDLLLFETAEQAPVGQAENCNLLAKQPKSGSGDTPSLEVCLA